MSAPPLSMSKSKPSSSEEQGLIGRSVHSLHSFGKTLALGGALYMGMHVAGGVGDAINHSLRESARADALEMVQECRDAVLCTLGKIHFANNARMNPTSKNRAVYKIVQTIQLGDHECKVGKTETGFVIAIGDTLYLAGRDETELAWTISEVKKSLNLISQSRSTVFHAVAYADKVK